MKRELAPTLAMRALAALGAVSVLVAVGLALVDPGMPFLPATLAVPLPYFAIGLFVWWRAPRHPVACRMLATTTVLAAFFVHSMVSLVLLPEIEMDAADFLALSTWALIHHTISDLLWGFLVVLVIRLIALLPDGHYWFTHERIVLRALWLLPLLYPLAFLLQWRLNKGFLEVFLVGPVLLVIRYVRLPDTERRALRWLLGTALLTIGAITVPLVLSRWARIWAWAPPAVLMMLPIAVGAAALVVTVVRYRLLGVDLGIRWTTRYGLLWLIFGLWVLVTASAIGATMGTAVPLGLAVVALVATYAVRLSAELAARVTQVQQQAHELAASRTRIVQAQDRERRRIERDLHDGIQQELVVLVTKLRLARNKLPAGADRASAALTEVQDDTYRVIDELRELSHGIHPAELSDQGLVAAVRSLARRVPIPVTVTAEQPVDTTRHATDIEESAFFLVSEALTNVLKHAHASHATIRLSQTAESLVVEIADDGIGIPDHVHDGSGLTGLRDRVGATGGQLDITSNPNAGTTVRAHLPAREATDP